MARAASLLVFLLSILVGIIGAFFLGNSLGPIGYDTQNFIGGILGLSLSFLLFILGALSLARSHRAAIMPAAPMVNSTSY